MFFAAESPQQVKGSLQSLNLDAVMNQTFVPDYTVRAVSDVLYVAVKRTLYLAAKRATLMEKSKRFGSELGSNEPIDYEVEKVNVPILLRFQCIDLMNCFHFSCCIHLTKMTAV